MYRTIVSSPTYTAPLHGLCYALLIGRNDLAKILRVRLGGFVAKYMGDGVLVYFGYPHAHEDDAERAVRAGLELTAAVTALKASAPLQTRVAFAPRVPLSRQGPRT